MSDSFVTPWTVVCQAPLPLGFSRQEYRSGLLCPSPGDLPYPGVEPLSLMYPALAGWSFTTSAIWEAHCLHGFPFTRISYSWNYTEYRLFKLTSFTGKYAVTSVPFHGFDSSFLFSIELYSLSRCTSLSCYLLKGILVASKF